MLPAGFILGAYRIETLLGRGAMGAVYQAVRVSDQVTVAVKTIHADLLEGREREAILARFRQEAHIGMSLRHPLIVGVSDYGQQDDLLYLVMERVDGQELGRLLNQQPSLPLGMNLAIVLQVLNALAYAHQQGVVHRDIKPANIMVRQDYTIALTDFGIAHLRGSELTHVGELLGSPLYMAPEQLWGDTVDARTDLFSTGVLLYFLLTQRRPFIGSSLAVLMQKILHEEPLPPSSINRSLPVIFDTVLQQALAKDPAQRFANAGQFADALRQARTEPLKTTVTTSITPAPLPLGITGSDETTVVVSTAEVLIESMTVLVQQCLMEKATPKRLQQLTTELTTALARVNHAATAITERPPLQAWCAGQPLATLAEQIQRDAPLPGRVLREARGDWLEQVQLFTLLWKAQRQLDDTAPVDAERNRMIRQLTDAFLDYANVLNPLLFSADGPQLTRISADLMRLDLLQLALEELEAEAEVRSVQQTLLLFAQQVMSRINVLIRQFLDSHDPLARFDVTNLLVEVEELITLAERLFAGGSTVVSMDRGTAMAEFIDNARGLSRVLTDELLRQIAHEHRRTVGNEEPDFSTGQGAFIGRLRQLGLIYRFVAYWQPDTARREALRLLAIDLHEQLEGLSAALFKSLNTDSPDAAELLWARLTLIADLSEQFGWPELRQQVLLAARTWVQAT